MDRPSAASAELLVDFIITVDGYASGEGWPGWWGLEGPEYLAWLDAQPEKDYTVLMGANTYRMYSSFAAAAQASAGEVDGDETSALAGVTMHPTVVFSSTLPAVEWPHAELVSDDAVDAVRRMKRERRTSMRTNGSLSLCRSLLAAGLVDRFRIVVFPLITGKTGRERIYDNYPDLALELVQTRTFDGRLQLLEYMPTLISGPPRTRPA
ncbi:dihydrofolate reductase family protein [Raineyella fluvialis]|uniref:Deaminase n=1 Tax=Raineyella fluvialis TaxID=2662261 RepID=A0A5Q2FF49_9ACTN|nr:dihydrofolate reductase family protein [Raineyella fluvialis]QGF24124.1 deaminase [Raineyella fluvialis]